MPAAKRLKGTKGKTSINHEGSRCQYLGRTGLQGPGASKAFKYGEGREYKTGADALKAAEEWMKALGTE